MQTPDKATWKAKRAALRKAGAPKCEGCRGRGEIRERGPFPQTVGCEDCGGLGYLQPPYPSLNEAAYDLLAACQDLTKFSPVGQNLPGWVEDAHAAALAAIRKARTPKGN